MNFKSENNHLRRTHLTGNGSGPSPVSQRLYPHENKLPNKAKIISKTYTQANARIRIASLEVSPSWLIQAVEFSDGYQNSSTKRVWVKVSNKFVLSQDEHIEQT